MLTSVCVFLPMLFLKGIIGSVLKDISLSIVFILTASLFAAVFIIPQLAKIKTIPAEIKPHRSLMPGLEKIYGIILNKSLKVPALTIVLALGLLGVSIYAADKVGISFIPAADYNELFVSMKLKPGSSLDESVRAADRMETLLHTEVPGIENVIFYAGMEDDLSSDSRTREAVWGHVLLQKNRGEDKDFKSIIRRANKVLSKEFPDAKIFNGGFDRLIILATQGAGFRVELSSESDDVHG